MGELKPFDPDYDTRVRRSFARQAFMQTLGVELVHLVPGEVDLAMPHRREFTQQHGYFHAGTTATIADTAAGYAALSLFPRGTGVLTVEFKINLLRPAEGERLVARGRVIKPGRTLSICRSEVYGVRGGREAHVATALLSMFCVEGLDD
jgi:uncharacterized protein (TIGR00369 family)